MCQYLDVLMELVGRLVPDERARDVVPSRLPFLTAPAARRVGVLNGLAEGPDVREHLILSERNGDGSLRLDQLATGSDHLGDG
jgi:hypothetical protein